MEATRYKDRIVAHVGHASYEPVRTPALLTDLDVPPDDAGAFAEAIRMLEEERRIEVDEDGRVRLPGLPDEGELEGTFRGSLKGFGFVIPKVRSTDGDIYIAPEATGKALSGDLVRIHFWRDRRRERYSNRGAEAGGGGLFQKSFAGEVIEVVRRKRASFTGEVFRQGPQWLLQPDGNELTTPVVLRDAESKGVKPGAKVVIELLEYPQEGRLGEGVVTRVLGEAGEPSVETQAVIAAYALPGEFPESCVQQARAASAMFDEEIARWRETGELPRLGRAMRMDLTGRFEGRTIGDDPEPRPGRQFVCTIDPPDAKDYDDAIAIRRLPRGTPGLESGGWELTVHIADVAHFIEPGSELDEEALKRGNSVYLPRLVIPMLPEVLSNGICSLQEGVPRYAKSAIMRYDERGNVRGTGVRATLIESAKRMTYLEAQALIDGDPEEAKRHAKTEPNYSDRLIETVREMDELARVIRARRHKQGMISLELPEVVLLYDEDGNVIDAEREDDAFTHTLIEMFMVEANECVARLFEEMRVPLIRRTHPEPAPGEVDHLRKAALVSGFRIPAKPTREEMQALLDHTRGTPASKAVHMAVLRTLSKAEYSPSLVGHFALASSAYAHFTSPIRRYPDLTAHRAVAAFLEATDNGRDRPTDEPGKVALGRELLRSRPRLCPAEDLLREVGRNCTTTEQNAEAAERELRTYLVLKLLGDKHIGDTFPAVVTGVLPRGIFVEIDKFVVSGMVSKDDLPGDVTRSDVRPFWKPDPRTGALVDQHSGRSWNIGDRCTVVIAGVDLTRRQLELTIADGEGRAVGKAKAAGGLKLGGEGLGGGMAAAKGAGFTPAPKRPGGVRRSLKSKRRDKGKGNHRRDA